MGFGITGIRMVRKVPLLLLCVPLLATILLGLEDFNTPSTKIPYTCIETGSTEEMKKEFLLTFAFGLGQLHALSAISYQHKLAKFNHPDIARNKITYEDLIYRSSGYGNNFLNAVENKYEQGQIFIHHHKELYWKEEGQACFHTDLSLHLEIEQKYIDGCNLLHSEARKICWNEESTVYYYQVD